MKTHNLLDVKVCPLFHKWICANRMNLYSNVKVESGDILQYYDKKYKVGIMFPDINDKKYLEDSKNQNVLGEENPVLFHNCTSEVYNNPELPFITKKTKFYEFIVEELCS